MRRGLRWEIGGRLRKLALGINIYTPDGQIDPEAQRKINAEQKRVLDCLLAGEDPRADTVDTSTPCPSKPVALTLDAAFRDYRGPYGPVQDVSQAQQRRYNRVHEKILIKWGPKKLASSVTLDDIEQYTRWRREEISASKQTKGKGGARQAEIEASCIARVLRWLRLNKGLPNIPAISVEELKSTLRAVQSPARPRYTDEEVAKIEKVIGKADPRLVMMLSIQGAQRAGQLRRAQRSGLTIERDASGNVTSVALLVPSSRKNPLGNII